MNYKALATVIAAASMTFADASAFIRLNIPPTPQSIAEQEITRIREKEYTDSLLNAITIDSLTRETYEMFPPMMNTPRILGNLNDMQYSHIEVLEWPSYSKLAGVVEATDSTFNVIYPARLSDELIDPIPAWFRKSLRFQNQISDASTRMMINNPESIEYADWTLPHPPRLPEEDHSFHAFLKRLNLPEVDTSQAVLIETEAPKRKNWLHKFNVMLQVSQAYVSSNWYQGGNSYVSGLFGFSWNVDLNQVYYPRLLFQSELQYRLAVNSNPKGSLHKYNTSQDQFQYTLKTGLKAFDHWFYSLNLLFNTQIFNGYPEDSKERSTAFLSPGTLNIGLGMTYSLQKNGLNLTASISPIAYNLKTCIVKNDEIPHEQFNIKPNRYTVSEIGSSGEVNMTWKFNDNISWKSRLFLFTDYSYFLAEWENTFNFQISKVLSTQIYLYPRFDSSTEAHATKWRHWMLKEILSFGISYTFATKK